VYEGQYLPGKANQVTLGGRLYKRSAARWSWCAVPPGLSLVFDHSCRTFRQEFRFETRNRNTAHRTLVESWTGYIQCRENPPYHYDYDLNINDDTPLFIYAASPFYCQQQRECLCAGFYQAIRDATEWILKQTRRPDLLLVRRV